MSKRKPLTPEQIDKLPIGTVEHYTAARDALDAAREALEATGIDPELIDAFEEAAHTEICSSLCLPTETRLRIEEERHAAAVAAIEAQGKRTPTVKTLSGGFHTYKQPDVK
jgi:4'-phosphopantetheinyl transferase EntD